jgi:hypothetical protein
VARVRDLLTWVVGWISAAEAVSVTTPDDRTFTVPAESRTYTVPAESRTYTVPAEDRTLTAEV